MGVVLQYSYNKTVEYLFFIVAMSIRLLVSNLCCLQKVLLCLVQDSKKLLTGEFLFCNTMFAAIFPNGFKSLFSMTIVLKLVVFNRNT